MHMLQGSIVEASIVQLQHFPHLGFNGKAQGRRQTQRDRDKTMAYATSTGPLSRTAAPLSVAGLIATLREAFQRHRIYSETVRELSELTNMELADLGLNRSMIKRVALDAAYGKAA